MARVAAASTQEERTQTARLRIRQAALELFGEAGFEATSMADISVRAGYSRTLALYHYPDKTALAVELLEDRIRRDNHLELLECPDGASAHQAWAALVDHLDAVIGYYGALTGTGARDATLRGEMALHAAALLSNDPAIKRMVHGLTTDLITRMHRLLEICRSEGMIRHDTDCRAVAVLHVHAIWGLAQALFANPQGAQSVIAAMRQFALMLEGLRSNG